VSEGDRRNRCTTTAIDAELISAWDALSKASAANIAGLMAVSARLRGAPRTFFERSCSTGDEGASGGESSAADVQK
jgi:hypothetical protein